MYAPADLSTPAAGGAVNVTVSVNTAFPYGTAVSVTVAATPPGGAPFDVAVRLPSWVAAPRVAVLLNGAPLTSGAPGTYVHVTRSWGAADALAFDLPMAVEAHPYTGATQLPPFVRYAYTYGPTLLAFTAPANWNATLGTIRLPGLRGGAPADWLVPANDGNALHWTVAGVPGALLQPNWEVDAPHARFSAYPAFDA